MNARALQAFCLASLLKMALAAFYFLALPTEAKERLHGLVPTEIASKLALASPSEENPS